MSRVRLNINDGILFFAFIYSSIDIFSQWNAFSNCYRPIQVWLIVSYASILTFRIAHYISQYLSEDGEDFILYSQRGYTYWINVGIMGLLFPFFTVWTIVGTVWVTLIQQKTPTCLPQGSSPWFIIFWLILCYIWIAIYTMFLVVAGVFEIRSRRGEEDLQLIDNEDIVRRWGRLRVLADYGIHILRRGLSPLEISALPEKKISKEDIPPRPCSICIDEFRTNDNIRILPACGHMFHKTCIDVWLLRNGMCPNCKTMVRYGRTESGSTNDHLTNTTRNNENLVNYSCSTSADNTSTTITGTNNSQTISPRSQSDNLDIV